MAAKVPLELDDSSTKAVREDDGTGDGEILDSDDSNDITGDGVDIDIERAGLAAVASDWSMDVTGDCSDRVEIKSFVAVVGEDDDEDSGPGEVVGEADFPDGECGDLRTILLGMRVVAIAAGAGDGDGSVRVVLTLSLVATVVDGGEVAFLLDAARASGLAIGTWAFPDLLRSRCRSVDEFRDSVDSSCCARFRFDLRLADLSRSTNRLPLPLLLTGLKPPMSLAISGRGVLTPDFMVEVLIRGVGGDSMLLKCSTMESSCGERRGS